MWKMLHLLYLYGKPGISEADLFKAGVDCEADTIHPLVASNAIHILDGTTRDYVLSDAAKKLLEICVVANKRAYGDDMRADFPYVFVIMPFSETWSHNVYAQLIEPAVRGAGLECSRGDIPVRVGDLSTNIWNEILKAGIIIADVSSANVNVFYELGLVHAVGKDALLLKRKDAALPADFGGAHYYEYSVDKLSEGRAQLQEALLQWSAEYRTFSVKALYGK
jgi:hypothetical protein